MSNTARGVPSRSLTATTTSHLIVYCASHGRRDDVLNVADLQGRSDKHSNAFARPAIGGIAAKSEQQDDERQPARAGGQLSTSVLIDHSLLRPRGK